MGQTRNLSNCRTTTAVVLRLANIIDQFTLNRKGGGTWNSSGVDCGIPKTGKWTEFSFTTLQGCLLPSNTQLPQVALQK